MNEEGKLINNRMVVVGILVGFGALCVIALTLTGLVAMRKHTKASA